MNSIIISSDLEDFFRDEVKWKREFAKLRVITKKALLKEQLKWGKPYYTKDGKNVVFIQGFKNYCALVFINGSFLSDPHNILTCQTEKIEQSRQLRFISIDDILQKEEIILEYIQEAINVLDNELASLPKKKKQFSVPMELTEKFENDPSFMEAFFALSPRRQHSYLIYFSSAKKPETRLSRIEKYQGKIFKGIGFNET